LKNEPFWCWNEAEQLKAKTIILKNKTSAERERNNGC
jgi:hypothetical protein